MTARKTFHEQATPRPTCRRRNPAWRLGLTAGLCWAGAAQAGEGQTDRPLVASLQLRSDLVGVAAGGLDRGVRHVDTADLAVDLDLETVLNWRGAVAHFDVLANAGGSPEALAESLQGVNNGEAGSDAVRLYQAWIETRLGDANLRAGLSDLNAEFDVADSAGLLMGSSFGIGGDLAGTARGAPSLYPSTALGVRLRLEATEARYWQVAVFNAHPGAPGDKGGVDLSFDHGVMAIAEHGWTGRGKVAFGVWGYSDGQPDLRATDSLGLPKSRTSLGAYGVMEAPLAWLSTPARTATGFLKLGLSDGRTTEVAASWQAGLLVSPALASRPESAASVGIAQAWLSEGARANRRDEGNNPTRAETQFEITYSDQVTQHLALQPDLQVVWRRDALHGEPLVVVLSLRLTAAY